MKSMKPAILRGKMMRATRLSLTGAPVYGDNNSVVTEGFISVAMTTTLEEVEALVSTNAAGKNCIAEPATQNLTGFGVSAVFCNVDFTLFEMLTGQELVVDENGQAYGITESTEVKLADVNWGLELWTGAGDDGFGYVLLPRLSGGIISDITIENAAINFTISGMNSKPNAWGAGPYFVETVSGVVSRLRKAMKKNDHRRIMVVDVAPPTEYSGSLPLLDPTDAKITAITATPTGMVVAISATPTGQPVFYDFGDGNWDYAETGAYSHTYAEAGTYVITGTSGGATVTQSVTVA